MLFLIVANPGSPCKRRLPTGIRLPKSSKRLGNLENLSSAFSQDFGSDNELLRSSLKGLGVQAYGHQKPPLSAFESGPVRRSGSFSFVAQ